MKFGWFGAARRLQSLLLTVVVVASLGLVFGCGKGKSDPGDVRVAGASDLVLVMEALIPMFEKASGKKVTFIPGSSGKLAAQLREGAPFDVFLSANVKFVDDVIAEGACDASTKAMYARGRVVIWVGPDAAVKAPADLAGLSAQEFKRIAIANPDHAPYGAAAKQALEAAGVWDSVKPRVVYGSNIKDTMQFVETGNAEVGIIALSLAKKSPGQFSEIPAELHAPIDQALVVCKNGKAQAGGREFAEFLRSAEVIKVMTEYGFVLPN